MSKGGETSTPDRTSSLEKKQLKGKGARKGQPAGCCQCSSTLGDPRERESRNEKKILAWLEVWGEEEEEDHEEEEDDDERRSSVSSGSGQGAQAPIMKQNLASAGAGICFSCAARRRRSVWRKGLGDDRKTRRQVCFYNALEVQARGASALRSYLVLSGLFRNGRFMFCIYLKMRRGAGGGRYGELSVR